MNKREILLQSITYKDSQGSYYYSHATGNAQIIRIIKAELCYKSDLVISEEHFNVLINMLVLNFNENYMFKDGLGIIKPNSPVWYFLTEIGAIS